MMKVFDQLLVVNVCVCLKLTPILRMFSLSGKAKSRSVGASQEDREKRFKRRVRGRGIEKKKKASQT